MLKTTFLQLKIGQKKVWGVRRKRSKKKLSSYDSVTGFFHLKVGGEMERLPVPGLVRLGKEMKMKSTSSCGC